MLAVMSKIQVTREEKYASFDGGWGAGFVEAHGLAGMKSYAGCGEGGIRCR